MDTPLNVTADGGDDLAAVYENAVQAWREAPAAEARALYRTRVFPLACERMREMRDGVTPIDLLFVPVGTQVYAPILAVLAHPASSVALLESETSHAYGLEVERALAGTAQFLHVRIDAVDVGDISARMKDVYDTRGLPSGARVAADVTGGRKTTTAAVSAVGSLLGWQLFYIEGVQERERDGLSHHERVIELPNVLDVFGGRTRDLARRLLRAGAWNAAVDALDELIEESAASVGDRALREVARAAISLREGDAAGVLRRLGASCTALGVKSEPFRGLLRAARDGDAGATAALLWVGGRACLAERQILAAEMLVTRARALLRMRGADGVRQTLALLGRHARVSPFRREAEALDRVLGRGLAAWFGRLG